MGRLPARGTPAAAAVIPPFAAAPPPLMPAAVRCAVYGKRRTRLLFKTC